MKRGEFYQTPDSALGGVLNGNGMLGEIKQSNKKDSNSELPFETSKEKDAKLKAKIAEAREILRKNKEIEVAKITQILKENQQTENNLFASNAKGKKDTKDIKDEANTEIDSLLDNLGSANGGDPENNDKKETEESKEEKMKRLLRNSAKKLDDIINIQVPLPNPEEEVSESFLKQITNILNKPVDLTEKKDEKKSKWSLFGEKKDAKEEKKESIKIGKEIFSEGDYVFYSPNVQKEKKYVIKKITEKVLTLTDLENGVSISVNVDLIKTKNLLSKDERFGFSERTKLWNVAKELNTVKNSFEYLVDQINDKKIRNEFATLKNIFDTNMYKIGFNKEAEQLVFNSELNNKNIEEKINEVKQTLLQMKELLKKEIYK
ncbi:MAG: hypothetical protein WC414_01025 [Patescibacteria group bacterium]